MLTKNYRTVSKPSSIQSDLFLSQSQSRCSNERCKLQAYVAPMSDSVLPSTSNDVEHEYIFRSASGPHNKKKIEKHGWVQLEARDIVSKSTNIPMSHLNIESDLEVPPEMIIPQFETLKSRLLCLTILLILQSFASSILEAFQGLLAPHPVILAYLTMIIGCGGTAGSQSTVLVIRGLATGKYSFRTYRKLLLREIRYNLLFAIVLSVITFFRLVIWEDNLVEVAILTVSLGLVIFTSGIFGAVLPLIFRLIHIDAEHAGPTIQVLIDGMSIIIVCMIASLFLRNTTSTKSHPTP